VRVAQGETRTVTFTHDKSDFGFYDHSGEFVVEPGRIDVYARHSSSADMVLSLEVR
jgi:beta-glucosidase